MAGDRMITIKKNGNGDTRTAKSDVTFREFQKANDSHKMDVYNVMQLLADKILESGKNHDHTKKEFEDQQYKAFKEAMNGTTPFNESDWYKMHVTTERHHLYSHVPEDVNLIDVLEMISDIICAALARNNERIDSLNIDSDILHKAINNTIRLINENIELKE